jgi:hypothetical protein
MAKRHDNKIEDPSVIRRRLIQNIYYNVTLSAVEKEQRIKKVESKYGKAESPTDWVSLRSQRENKKNFKASVRSDETYDSFTTSPQQNNRHRLYRGTGFCLAGLIIFCSVVALLLYYHYDDISTRNESFSTTTPTTSPANILLYNAPSEEQCELIASGLAIENEDEKIERTFEIKMDVQMNMIIDFNLVLLDFQQKLQEELAPALAGCSRKEQNMRQRNQFVVANANIKVDYLMDQDCNIKEETCNRVLIELSLTLNGEDKVLSLLSRITDVFGAESLMTVLDLPSPFEDVTVLGVLATYQTDSPTQTPTASSSLQPTFNPTSAPTIKPTRSRQGSVNLALSDVTTLNKEVVKWMINEDSWVPYIDSDHVLEERYALVAFYLQTNGNGWFNKEGWMSSSSVCDWHGVTCSDRMVTNLVLVGNQLAGMLPTELGLLSRLSTLDLAGNLLQNTLISEISSLIRLQHLKLDNNQISGALPTFLGDMTGLISIYLDRNKFKSTLPTRLGNLLALSKLSLCKSNRRFFESIGSRVIQFILSILFV